jgi:ABC-type amino acid transport substrate-binding protein
MRVTIHKEGRQMKILGSLASAALLLGALLWNGNAQAADDKIKKINERGTLRVCFAESVPNTFKDPRSGQWQGFNVDMANALVEEMKVKLEIVDTSWATIIASLTSDKCDIALVGLFRTAARAQVILFANPFQIQTLSVAVPENSSIKTLKDLDDPKFTMAVVSGSAEETYMKTISKATIKSLVTDKIATVFLEAAGGRTDAVVTDTGTVRKFLQQNAQLKLRELSEPPFAPRGTSYAVAPGEYHFLQFINVWLERMESSGMKQKFWDKWHNTENK